MAWRSEVLGWHGGVKFWSEMKSNFVAQPFLHKIDDIHVVLHS